MAKRFLWYIIALLVAISVVSVSLQLYYVSQMHRVYFDQFTTLARRALDEVSYSLVQNEVRRYLRSGLTSDQLKALGIQEKGTLDDNHQPVRIFTGYLSDGSEMWNGYGQSENASCPPWAKARNEHQDLNDSRSIVGDTQDAIYTTYFSHRLLLDEVILRLVLEMNDLSINRRLETDFLKKSLQKELAHVGIDEPFEFFIYNRTGKMVFQSCNREQIDENKVVILQHVLYPQIYRNIDDQAYVEVVFLEHHKYTDDLIYTGPPAAILLIIVFMSTIAVVLLIRYDRFVKARKNFASNMTHELKTPVSSIRLACEMLMDPSVDQAEERRMRINKMMLKEVDRLTLLVDKVLQSSSLEKKALKFYPIDIDAHDEINDLASAYAMKVRELGGTLTLKLNAEQHQLYCDKLHFQNIISNLIDNSLKYRHEKRVPEITIETINRDKSIAISVIDNGIGIAKQDRKHIFEQFYRVHTGERHDVKGFGLGLAYVMSAVQTMNGTVHVSSKLGVGTKMTITLTISTKQHPT